MTMRFMGHYARWFCSLWRWLVGGPRLFWLMFLVAAVCLTGAFGFRTEPAYRWFGGALQVCGILTVVWTIKDTRARFGQPGYGAIVHQWLRARPRLRPTEISASAVISLATDTVKASAFVWHSPPDGSPERRIESIEKNLLILRDDFHAFKRETEDANQRHSQALDQERQTRTQEDEETRKMLEDAQVGGLHVATIGVLWLLIGLLLTTGSVEFACWLGRECR